MKKIMIIKKNEPLAKYTTIKIGGIAKNFFIPEDETELIELVRNIDGYRILGGGSNLLINDKSEYDNVIYMKSFNEVLEMDSNKLVRVGSSVSLQKLINFINENEVGGIEYLYSVPGLVGGAIYMNAGRGRSYNKSISDYVFRVKVFHNNEVKWLSKQECNFSYRKSVFQSDEYIILEIEFKFEKKDKELSKEERLGRLEFSKKVQDSAYPNFGTVFCNCNTKLLKLVRLSFAFSKGGLQFSKKLPNWFINKKNGTFDEAYRRINRVRKVHKFFNKPLEVEVKIWQ